MESLYSVKLSKLVEEYSLDVLRKGKGYEKCLIRTEDVNRPGLQLIGFFDYFDPMRLQVLGKVESTFLEGMTAEERRKSFEQLLAQDIPALILTRGMEPFPECMEMAEKYGADALRFRLIADDAVEIKRVASHQLVGSAPELIRHYMELRGIGVVDVRRLFGVSAVKDEANIDLVVNLEQWRDGAMYDRLGLEELNTTILDVQIPAITIPVKPGRNLAVIVEVAAMNNRHKKMGYNAAQAFTEQINKHFDEAMAAQAQQDDEES